jgi:hypothetical protein
MRRHLPLLLIVLALGGTATACTATLRVYDEPNRDYHRWDGREERAYRVYLGEQHREYREFGRLERRDQDEYWAWRHRHPEADRDRR